ncbi:MAG: hypothetical protein K8R35_04985 [Bacteroidales bacterium]|nr:hypothetical protein [Bacteroidales bacterium]
MKKFTFYLVVAVIVVILLLLLFPKSNDEQSIKTSPVEQTNLYVKKYAGGYTIEVKGISSENSIEAYALADNGQAKWMWIVNDGSGGANLESEKTGTWTATENKITINIKGNTGIITEDYVLIDGVFTNTISNDRYLKLNK